LHVRRAGRVTDIYGVEEDGAGMIGGRERLPQARETAELKASAIDRQAYDRRRQEPSLFTASGAGLIMNAEAFFGETLLTPYRSGWAARHDCERSEGVDRLAALIERSPSDPGDPLRLRSRRGEFDDLAFKMDHIVRPHRGKPSQLVHAKAEEGVRPERARFDGEAHRHRRRVPPRGSEASENRTLSGLLVEMVELGIVFGGEPLDLLSGHMLLGAFEAHAENEIIEPLDHRSLPDRDIRRSEFDAFVHGAEKRRKARLE
jgi:hypothetical protein